jgi:hypothetical protein
MILYYFSVGSKVQAETEIPDPHLQKRWLPDEPTFVRQRQAKHTYDDTIKFLR